MFHVEQFMIPNVKQLLPKLRRNVITSAISLLVLRSKCFTWNITRDRSRPLLTADTQSSATQFFDKATDSAA